MNEFMQLNRDIPMTGKGTLNKSKNLESSKNMEGSLECTFKPSISKKSAQLAVQMQPSFERLTMALKSEKKKTPYKPAKNLEKKYSRERIEKLSQPRTLRTEPNEDYQEKSRTEKSKSTLRHSNSRALDVAARNQLWEEQKRIKL